MTTLRRFFMMISIALVASIFLVACGGGQTPNTANTTSDNTMRTNYQPTGTSTTTMYPTPTVQATMPVNSSEKLPKSATPKVSRGGEFSVGTAECQSKIPQNVCSPKRCPSFFTYKFSYLLVISSCPSPCVFREGEGLPFTGFAPRSWNTPALRFSREKLS
jgi:hypothetical protein